MNRSTSSPHAKPYGLTKQELRVLRLLCDGMCDKDISKTCAISASTVKRHLENMYRKIGVTSRLEAAMFAVSNGLIATALIGEYGGRESALIEIQKCHRKIEKYLVRSKNLLQQFASPAPPQRAPHNQISTST